MTDRADGRAFDEIARRFRVDPGDVKFRGIDAAQRLMFSVPPGRDHPWRDRFWEIEDSFPLTIEIVVGLPREFCEQAEEEKAAKIAELDEERAQPHPDWARIAELAAAIDALNGRIRLCRPESRSVTITLRSP